MKFFHREKGQNLSESQGVPLRIFRCDICKFVQPLKFFAGTITDTAGDNSTEYNMCYFCSHWLGFGWFYVLQDFYRNFSEKQREKIKALHRELEAVPKDLPLPLDTKGSKAIHSFLRDMPNLREIIDLRSANLPGRTIKDSYRLTREANSLVLPR